MKKESPFNSACTVMLILHKMEICRDILQTSMKKRGLLNEFEEFFKPDFFKKFEEFREEKPDGFGNLQELH